MLFWQHILWLIVLSIGNAEVLVTIVNRVHSIPVHERYLREFRHMHDLLIPLFPSWLVVVIGFFGPGVFLKPITPAEVWVGMAPLVKFYCWVCFFGFAGFLFSVLRYALYRVPSQQTAFKSTVINVEQELGFRPTGEGPFLAMTKVPWNQCFEVEWTERTFEFNRLPDELDGKTILHLTDMHFIGTISLPFFEHVCKRAQTYQPDMICFTGDLLDGNQYRDWIPSTLGKLEAPLGKFFILGNHDWYLDVPPIRETLLELEWQDVSSRVLPVDVGGEEILIGGDERPWLGTHPDFKPRDDRFRLLLSHTPDNFGWAKSSQMDLVLAGHNHGGQVVLPAIGPVYSPSVHGCRNASGVYFSSGTLMFVSRGVSGRHPLRINCRPEVAIIKLVKKS